MTVGVILACLVATMGTVAMAATVTAADGGAGADRVVAPADGVGDLSGDHSFSEADAAVRGVENDSLAKSMAVGDLNGDGEADLLVGAPFNGSAGDDAGAVYVFYGPVTGDVNASAADAVLLGESAGDWAGWSVAAGDVDGDGYDDAVVGAPLADRDGRGSGAVYVVHGGDDLGGTTSLDAADGILVGEAERDNAGHAVAAADVGGGPASEVIVGAVGNDAGGEDAGAAYVLDYDATTIERSLASARVRYTGVSAGDRTGSSVAGAGDFDGDGDGDVVVGARDAGADDQGAAYVVTRANASGSVSLDDAALELLGTGDRDHAGWSVAGVGDTNGDGIDDVAIGAPYSDEGGHNAGVAYVVLGGESRDGTEFLSDADRVLVGESPGDRAGFAVAAAGTADDACDDYTDVMVGAPGDDAGGQGAGVAYLVAGDEDPQRTMALADAGGKYTGTMDRALAGWSVAGGADLTGDGRADLLVGAPDDGTNGHFAGAAYVFAGECEAPAGEPVDDGDDDARTDSDDGGEDASGTTTGEQPSDDATTTAGATATGTTADDTGAGDSTTTAMATTDGSSATDDEPANDRDGGGLPVDPIIVVPFGVGAAASVGLLFRQYR